MSKRHKKPKPKPPVITRFKVGDRVRVKPGLRDDGHPDIPLGGWAGTITEVHQRGMYSVHWSRETLASIHPIYKKRCLLDGAVLEEYWFGEDDLEPDAGGPLVIEQPTAIIPRPLSPQDQADRVRMVFGLTSDDFLPAADDDALETYYDFLEQRLSLPLRAKHYEMLPNPFAPAPLRHVEAVALDRETGWNEEEELDEDKKTAALVAERPLRSLTLLFLEAIAVTTLFGAMAGAAMAAMPWARWAAGIGGGAWGTLMTVVHAKHAQDDLPFIASRFRKAFGSVIGLTTGVVQGACLGIMVVALPGAVLGSLLGAVLRRLARGKKWLVLHLLPSDILVAAACGVTAQAFYLDRAAATTGCWQGALIGLACGVLFCWIILPLSFLTTVGR